MAAKPLLLLAMKLGQGNIFRGVCQEQTPPGTGTPPGSSACWEIWSKSGRYASYRNAFLLIHILTSVVVAVAQTIITGRQRSCRKEIFSQVSFILSTGVSKPGLGSFWGGYCRVQCSKSLFPHGSNTHSLLLGNN